MSDVKKWAAIILAALALATGIFFAGRWTMHREDMAEFLAAQPPAHDPPPTPAKPDTVHTKPIVIYRVVTDSSAIHRADSLNKVIVSMRADTAGLSTMVAYLTTPWGQEDTVVHSWVIGKIITTIEPAIKRAIPVLIIDSVYAPPPVHIIDTEINWLLIVSEALIAFLLGGLIL